VFCVFLSVIYGPRRIFLFAASVFTITAFSCRSANFWAMLALEALAAWPPGLLFLTMTSFLLAPKRLIIFWHRGLRRGLFFTRQRGSALQGGMPTIFPGAGIFWHAAL